MTPLAVALALASAAGAVARSGSPSAEPADPAEVVAPVACPIDVPTAVEVECGLLKVPEDHDRPDGPRIRLRYAVLRSTAADPEPDPVVYTSGGPGYSSLVSVWAFASSPILQRRDIIVVEQRGNRFAEPSLACDVSVWWDEVPGHTPCLDAIRARGVDPAHYTTDQMVRDLVVLRQALGHERWNLFGSSFSTSLMLLAMEADPAGSRSAILHSVKPPEETVYAHESDSPLRAIDHLFAACAADPSCDAAYPDLPARFDEAVRRLDEEPVELTVGAEELPVDFDGDHLIGWIVIDQLYEPALPGHGPAYLPLFIDRIADGRTEPLVLAARARWADRIADPNWSWGLLLAVNCQQDLPAAGDAPSASEAAARDRLQGFARSTGDRAVCRAWDLPPQAPAAEAPVRSDVPALVLAGSFDPVTPPEWSRSTAEHLGAATYVEFPAAGHDVTAANPCADELAVAFLDDPGADLDTSCVDRAPHPAFALPGDLFDGPGLARSAAEVSIGEPAGVGWVETVFLAGFVAVLAAAVALVVSAGRWAVHRRFPARSALAAHALAVAAIAGTLAVPFLLTAVNRRMSRLPPLAAALGPERDHLPATVLAWVAPALGLAALALGAVTVWAWAGRRWSPALRVGYAATFVALAPTLFLLARWDLFGLAL